MHRKAGLLLWLGNGGRAAAVLFEKSAHLLVESPGKRAFMSTIQTDLPSPPRLKLAMLRMQHPSLRVEELNRYAVATPSPASSDYNTSLYKSNMFFSTC
jgi:hypothetical protein